MNRLSLVLVPLLLLHPESLPGQDSTRGPTPFRKGQWAAQFQAGSSFGSLGFIKFRSPTHAYVLDLRILGTHGENSTTDSAGNTQFRSLGSSAAVQVRFGWRRYGGDGTGSRIVSNYSLGVLGGFHHDVSYAPGLHDELNGLIVGAFGDVGGTYLLTPKFGIGALATGTLSYDNDRGKTSSGSKYRSWSISGSAVSASLVATVFF